MRHLAAVFAIGACAGARPTAMTHSSSIDAIAEAAMRDGGAVGLSIVVMRGDRVVHARGYGLADVERRVAASERSVYPLASLSKQYWAAAIAQLSEQNRLAIDSSIVDVLYNFPDRRVAVRHLLTQTSGLGDDRADEDDVRFSDAPKLAFEPGSWWLYSNRGAILARRLVEQVTGGSWDHYLHDRIAKPLGLDATTTCTMDNHVAMYDKDHKPWSETALEMARIAFVCADALDVAKFERSLDAGALVKPATLAAMRAPTTVAGLALPYGWFTRIADLGGHVAYGHTGSLPGVSIAAFRFPADDLTIAVLINSAPKPHFRAHDLVAKIARSELGLAEPQLPGGDPPAGELEAIAGTYTAGNVHVQISARDGHAWLTLVVGRDTVFDGALAWAGGRSFAGGPDGVNVDAVATFLPATGKPTAIAVGHRFLLDQLFRRD